MIDMMEKLKVIFIQNQLCGRAWKEAKILVDAGVEVSLIELNEQSKHLNYTIFTDHFTIPVKKDLRSMLKNKKNIISAIKGILEKHDYNIIHTHNAPDNLAVWCLKIKKIPLIHDIHDVLSLTPIKFSNRIGNLIVKFLYNRWEKKVCTKADGILTTSLAMRDFIKEKYSPKCVEFLENKALKKTYPKVEKIQRNDGIHVVYVGGISIKKGSSRSLLSIFEKMIQQDIHVHVYPICYWPETLTDLKNILKDKKNLHCHDPVHQNKLITEISKYDYGLIFFAEMNENIKLTTSNKLYEYQIAGLPIISNVEGYMRHYIEKKGCGLIVDSVDELRKKLKKISNFNLDTSDCFMDERVLLDLYEKVRQKYKT